MDPKGTRELSLHPIKVSCHQVPQISKPAPPTPLASTALPTHHPSLCSWAWKIPSPQY